jgi:hypothetical protein
MGNTLQTMKTILMTLLLSAIAFAQSNAAFDEEHTSGVKRNPQGLEFTISTVDGSSTYHLSDVIRFKLSIRAVRSIDANAYTFETLTYWNTAGLSDDLVMISPGLPSPIHSQKRKSNSGVCCNSKRRYIGKKPSTAEFSIRLIDLQQTTRMLQPDFSVSASTDVKPGEFYVFLQTVRVLHGWPKSEQQRYSEKGPVVTSNNVLHLTILPDEANPSEK